MKKTKKLLLLAALFFAARSVSAQQNGLLPLKTGDKIPDLVFDKVLNYAPGKIKISDFKGKLLILDFWFTGCTVCIQQFPKLEQLQHQFGDRLVILPVGFDIYKKGAIEEFVAKRKGTTRSINLPVVVQHPEDSVLLSLFPVQGYPHEIWVDTDGTVAGITDQTAVTAENITSLLRGNPVPFRHYIIQKKLDGCSSFLIGEDSIHGHPTYGSLVTGYIDTIKTNTPFDLQCDHSLVRLFEVNKSIYSLYKDAYKNAGISAGWNKRVIADSSIKHSYKDVYDIAGGDNWSRDRFRQENLFCYELILPRSYSLNEAYSCMVKDLDRYFKIRSRIETRKIKCLALFRTSAGDKLRTKHNADAPLYTESEDQLDASMKNIPVKILVTHLNGLIKELNVLDETGYEDDIDIEVHLSKNYNLSEIGAALNKYGLGLREVERELDMLVLTNQK